MSKFYPHITSEQEALLADAALFFVATHDPAGDAGEGPGPINLSPKGGVPLHVLGPNRVAWADHPGSGNETARHLGAGSPITVMACTFSEADAGIVRLYGRGRVLALEDPELDPRVLARVATELKAPRQVIQVEVDRTMTSCGYGVPVLAFVRERRKEDRGRRFKD